MAKYWKPKSLLEITDSDYSNDVQCKGTADHGGRCRWRIRGNRGDATPQAIFRACDRLARIPLGQVDAARDLHPLAISCLCADYHRGQVNEVVAEWQDKIRDAMPTGLETPPATPERFNNNNARGVAGPMYAPVAIQPAFVDGYVVNPVQAAAAAAQQQQQTQAQQEQLQQPPQQQEWTLKLDTIEAKILKFKQTLDAAQLAEEKATKRCRLLEKKLQDAETDGQQYKEQASGLRKELAKELRVRGEAEAQLHGLQTALAAKNSELIRALTDLPAVKQQSQRVEIENLHLRAEADRAKGKIQGLEADCTQLRMEVQDTTTALRQCEHELDETRRSVTAMSVDKQEMQLHADEKVARVAIENMHLRTEAELAQTKLDEQTAALRKAQSDLEEERSWVRLDEQAMAALRAELASNAEVLKTSQSSLEAAMQTTTSLEAEKTSLTTALQAAHTELATARQQVTALETSHAHALNTLDATIQSDLSSAQQRIKQLKGKNTLLKRRVDAIEPALSKLEDDNARLRTEAAKTQALQAALAGAEETRAEKVRLQNEVAGLKDQIMAMESAMRQAQTIPAPGDTERKSLRGGFWRALRRILTW